MKISRKKFLGSIAAVSGAAITGTSFRSEGKFIPQENQTVKS